MKRPGRFLEFAHVLADISGEAILPHFRKPLAVKNKAGLTGFDPVTAADRAAERAIRKAIVQRFPGHGVVGEEYGTIAGEGRYSWLVDPIDGTRAFITGSPLWGTLIALLDGGMPDPGAHEPALHRRAILVRRPPARAGGAQTARPAASRRGPAPASPTPS